MSAAPSPTARRRLKVVCPHDCPDTCVMTVDVEGGRAVAIGGDPDHRFTQGFLCAKVNQYLDRVYSPERLLHPMRRVGRKGEGRFERISWNQALDLAAARLREIAAAHGPQSILPYSYAGNMGLLGNASMDRRFFHALGASLLDRTICASAGGHGYRATCGKTMGYDPEAVVEARLIVAWGGNIVSSNVHLWPFVEEARRRGARLVTIDPYRSRTAEKSDQHIALQQSIEDRIRIVGLKQHEVGARGKRLDPHRLERDGLIEESSVGAAEPSPGRDRRFYRITSLGRAVVAAELERLKGVLELAGGRSMIPRVVR